MARGWGWGGGARPLCARWLRPQGVGGQSAYGWLGMDFARSVSRRLDYCVFWCLDCSKVRSVPIHG